MTANDVRKMFKDLGYTAKLQKHSLIENCKKLMVYFGETCVVGNFSVYPKELYEQHKVAISKANDVRGTILSNGDKII